MLIVESYSYRKLEKFLGSYILDETLKLSASNIKKVFETELDGHLEEIYSVNVNSENFDVMTLSIDKNVMNTSCTCNVFKRTKKCKHIGLALAVYFEGAYDEEEKLEKDTSLLIFNSLINKDAENKKIIVKLTPVFDFLRNGVNFKLKIGIEKDYLVGNKIWSLISVIDHGVGKVDFGNYFTYDTNLHILSDEDRALINLYSDYLKLFNYDDYKAVNLDYNRFECILNQFPNKLFYVNNHGYSQGYELYNPIELSLAKVNDFDFSFNFDYASFNFLTDDCNFYYDNKLFKIPENVSSIIKMLKNSKQSSITLNKENSQILNKKIRKDFLNINIDENIIDDFQVITPKVKIFVDYDEDVILDLIFVYGNSEINYFAEDKVIRNDDFECSVVTDILNFGFIQKNNKFIIDTLYEIGEFFETGLFQLNEMYEVFTSTNCSDRSLVKIPTITSQFSMGSDNILAYDFKIDGISDSELEALFSSLKLKKKYHKLKNGNLINTESSDLKDLMNVMNSLDITSSQGFIPKYRALYLDSVSNYNIISTDNSFKKFINNFNEFKNVDIKLDSNDSNILRDYQKDGVKWLYNIYKTEFGGILADEMGLGKTLQTICFFKQVLKEKPNAKILVVTPTALVYNWANEFVKFAKELKYTLLVGSKDERLTKLKNDSNIFLTTYGMLRQDSLEYDSKHFDLIIIDEAQNIKNPKAGISKALKSVNANVKIALTGTPVENSILEVWSIFDFIMPGYLNTLNKFQDKFMFKDITDEAHDKLMNLSKLINPFILRRKKKDVLNDLPEKMENVIYLELPESQKKLYAMQVKKTKEEYDNLVKTDGFMKSQFKILQLLTRLRQICVDPSLVFDNYTDESIKTTEVIKLLKAYIENGHKVLLFTSFRSALANLKKILDEENITNYTIDGSVTSKERSTLVDSFNKDNTNVFLITLKAGGTGLNLTSADVVIHYDLWWNPQVENQATDRAHRIGQRNNVEVIKLVCTGTIEEKIIDLQNKKKILNDTLIDSTEDLTFSSLNENDIQNLFSFVD